MISPADNDPARDPTWASRAKQYWDLQTAKYGWLFDGFTLHYEEVEGQPVIVTSARVKAVLPGPRVTEKEWAADRLANGPVLAHTEER